MGFFPERILEWVAISYSREISQPRGGNLISCIGRQILYHPATWDPQSPSSTLGNFYISFIAFLLTKNTSSMRQKDFVFLIGT